ncbi:glycoside hydrolase family 13 protein [Jeotgalibacillus sp. S-D1]|uniref:glycoside hydrolase family 13 protein n=1 Tax=Jeotgalibacillus sp. S-D1 TaxID=2552189 RepID=UPI001059EA30|nr:glycoside hydrolase family 13 protein [Jeotgalibacillus sp. S-D1]TDL30874.1 glycoside hydrolase family 13 protein [Jeotgalibacillus sp. S-D1]
MKRMSAVFLVFTLLFSFIAAPFLSATAQAENGPYDSVVIRGSEAPLDWGSNNNPLTYNPEKQAWQSSPIPLTGGKKIEFKYVYDGEWMGGDNLVFTPDRNGNYIFTFYPQDHRRIDVQSSDGYDGSVTLNVTVPESTPTWAVPTLATSLNGFNYELTPLEKSEKDREWTIEIEGNPGDEFTYQYGLGAAQYKESNTEKRSAVFSKEGTLIEDTVTGWEAVPVAEKVTHDFNHTPFLPTEKDHVTGTVTVDHYGPINAGAIYFTTDGTSPKGKRGEVENGSVVPLTVQSAKQNDSGLTTSVLSGVIPKQDKKTPVKYKIDVWDEAGEGSQFADTNSFSAEKATEFAYYVDKFTSPQWAKDASIYHVFVDRFRDGNPLNNEPVDPELPYDERLKGWMGGDLAGVKEKISYIKELGVDTIWISPVFEGPYSHGYHPTDFKEIDHRFGDKQVMKELIEEAHEKELKVVYDFVPNHTSSSHPFFEDAKAKGEGSPYYNWYTFTEWPSKYNTFYGIDELPELNNDNKETRDYILNDVVPYWLSELDFDGFRLDYAKGPSYSYWVDFRHAVKELNPDAFIFGEVWDTREKINSYAGKLDGALDFGLSDTMVNVFAKGNSMKELSSTIKDNLSTYPEEYAMVSFLDNHDKPRFLFEAGGDVDKLKLAAGTQFTLPGTPAIYYGTEVGLSQSKDHNEVSDWKDRYFREMMPWEEKDQNLELKTFYQDIIKLRNKEKALRTGEFSEIVVTNDVMVYERTDKNKKFLVVINKGKESNLSINKIYGQHLLHGVKLTNALDKKEIKAAKGKLNVLMPAESFAVYEVSGKLEKGNLGWGKN